VRALADAPGADLATDEEIVGLLDAVIAGAYRLKPRGGRPRADTLRAHRDLTEAAKVVLAGRFRERLVLHDVAGAVHASPFHLARVFKASAGMTMHRYLTRLRVRAALDELADAGRDADLSRLALSLGFYDQSHLANAFRAEAGLSPSRWRREATPARVRRMSKILQD
jgi:AraC-like DNA-binding protein